VQQGIEMYSTQGIPIQPFEGKAWSKDIPVSQLPSLDGIQWLEDKTAS